PLRGARSRPRRARGDEDRDGHGREADRLHGARRPSESGLDLQSLRDDSGSPPMSATTESGAPRPHPNSRPLRRFVLDNRAALGTLAVFIVMMAIFVAANPRVFLSWPLYSSVLVTLPVALF